MLAHFRTAVRHTGAAAPPPPGPPPHAVRAHLNEGCRSRPARGGGTRQPPTATAPGSGRPGPSDGGRGVFADDTSLSLRGGTAPDGGFETAGGRTLGNTRTRMNTGSARTVAQSGFARSLGKASAQVRTV
ncbi:hypothetical protein GCM10010387_42400 [Streptomyces inusitatus]|uniref:Uncharacterized protein n=1 Tax=Streptomyces inusitatus TaxID=68221 RepID=A0A918UYY5_9ACTN|nr:hypothetical protein GCM10010387_42400 [Streptomyces inusitatus]